jgi:lipopolysaccharide/colanic/teichoic acid biosynthesis glycosyltransferase
MQIELVKSREAKQQGPPPRAQQPMELGLATELSSTQQPVELVLTTELSSVDFRRRFYFASKRVLDVLMAVMLLIALAPIILVIAIMIKLDSPGPIIFRQKRVGTRRKEANGRNLWEMKTFTFYKFRSMRADADSELHRAFIKAFMEEDYERMADIQQACQEETVEPRDAFTAAFLPEQEQALKLTQDPRVTPVGRVLRKTSLDEVPQLWNVLKGEMSLVGPRPDLPYSVADYKPWHFERLNAQPGITGLWQVEGRSQVSWDDLVRMDIEYIQNQSLWLDLKILLKTPLAMLNGKGAA